MQGELNRLVGAHPRDRAQGDRGARASRGAGPGGLPDLRRRDAAALLELHDPARDLDAGARAARPSSTRRLEAIGPVNLVADEEYRELDERLTFLRTQHDDLTASIKDLEKALRGMTRTAQERFAQAFEEINGHFARLFARLFEGGRAELRLVEAEEGGDPLDTGVELMAQPRGKRLQSVSLMSGGERALTGLALLFAIFYFRPSPFCVLDEVDAPLDDANIHRFLRVLRELTSADAVPGHHPQSQDDGSGRHPLRCHDGGAGALQAGLREPGGRGGGGIGARVMSPLTLVDLATTAMASVGAYLRDAAVRAGESPSKRSPG